MLVEVFLVAVLAGPSLAAVADVSLDAATLFHGDTHAYNNHSLYRETSDRLFGITAYEGVNQFYPNGTLAPSGVSFINDWGVAGPVGFGGGFHWVLPNDGNTTMTEASILEWFGNGSAAELFFNYSHPDRYVYGKALPEVAASHHPNFKYVLGVVPGDVFPNNTPKNGTLWGVLAAEYIKLCRQADPSISLFHLTNEPNAHWFHDSRTGSDYAQFFANASAVIQDRVNTTAVAVRLGGPVLCWPPVWPPAQSGQTPWYTWGGWAVPLMDATLPNKSLDWFDFHAYDIDIDTVVGSMHTVAAYSSRFEAYTRNTLPSAVTEHNFRLNATQWHNYTEHFIRRAIPNLRALVTMSHFPETAFMLQTFDFSAVAGDTGGRFQGDATLAVTPMMDLYNALKPWRGRQLRVLLSSTASPDLVLEATMAADNSSFTLLYANVGNATLPASSVNLLFATGPNTTCSYPPTDATIHGVSTTLLSPAGHKALPPVDPVYAPAQRAANAAFPALPAATVVVAVFNLSTPTPATVTAAPVRSFAPVAMQEFTMNSSAPVVLTASVPSAPPALSTSCFSSTVVVRFGLLGDLAQASTVVVSCGGGCVASFPQNVTLHHPGPLNEAVFPGYTLAANTSTNITLALQPVTLGAAPAAPQFLSFLEVSAEPLCCT